MSFLSSPLDQNGPLRLHVEPSNVALCGVLDFNAISTQVSWNEYKYFRALDCNDSSIFRIFQEARFRPYQRKLLEDKIHFQRFSRSTVTSIGQKDKVRALFLATQKERLVERSDDGYFEFRI